MGRFDCEIRRFTGGKPRFSQEEDSKKDIVSVAAELCGIALISLIFVSYIQKKLEDKGLFGKYTLHDLFDELDVIECFVNLGNALDLFDELDVIECFVNLGNAPIQGEILKKQEDLYSALDVKPLLASAKTSET